MSEQFDPTGTTLETISHRHWRTGWIHEHAPNTRTRADRETDRPAGRASRTELSPLQQPSALGKKGGLSDR